MKCKHKIIAVALLLITNFFITNNRGMAMAGRPYDYYREKLKEVDTSDGVSKEEAIIIAQNYLIGKGLDRSYIITKPTVEDFEFSNELYKWNEWKVIFKATYIESIKQANIFGLIGIFKWWISVSIDKKTGEVKSMGGPDL